MHFKPGTIGFAKLNTNWLKCVVQEQAGIALAVRIAPQLQGRLIHIEQFLPENKFRTLGYTSTHRFSLRQRIDHRIDCKKETLKRKLSRKSRRHRLELKRFIFTGAIGWVKIYSKGLFFWRKKWHRCLVLSQENTTLTICCSPNLSIANVRLDDFLADHSQQQIRVKKYQPYW